MVQKIINRANLLPFIILLIFSTVYCDSILPPLEELKLMSLEEKEALYNTHKMKPFLNMVYPLPPFGGYYKLGNFKEGIVKYYALMLGGGLVFIALRGAGMAHGNYFFPDHDGSITAAESFVKVVIPIMMADIYFQSKKFNKDLRKAIFEPSSSKIWRTITIEDSRLYNAY